MQYAAPDIQSTSRARGRVNMKDRQVPLARRYAEAPAEAVVIDTARTSSRRIDASCPLYTEVAICDENSVSVPVAVHKAVGGESDYPTPGDILCAAIAACLDSTIRVVANRVGVRLKKLDIEVRGTVDVRGTLRIDDAVPVAFQKFEIDVAMKPAGFVPGKLLDKLLRGAERSCIVIQSLGNGPEVILKRV